MRIAERSRKTRETDIELTLNVDGSGNGDIRTGVGFFDHMLESFAKHSGFDLKIRCAGDVHVDFHHTVEDIGIVLGQAFNQCLADKTGVRRFGVSFTPMDEALAEVSAELSGGDGVGDAGKTTGLPSREQSVQSVIDLSGRPFLVYNAQFSLPIVGDFPTELVEEFFRAFAMNAMVTLHINVPYGKNTHHIIEAIFKGVGRALAEAARIEGDVLLSTKGVL